MRALAPVVLALALAHPASGDTPVGDVRAMLERASRALEAAEDRETRIAALARAVQAHERALALLRAGLRRLAAEDARLSRKHGSEHDRLVRLLGGLESLARAPGAALLAFPGGPVRAARAARLMGAAAPAMAEEVADLSSRLEGLRTVRLEQEIARSQAADTLAALQRLRAAALSAARGGAGVPDRAALARQAAAARARARDLQGLADALSPAAGEVASPAGFQTARGELVTPVSGRVVSGFGGDDPWGRAGRGLTFAAPPGAMVAAPAAGTVRYAGPLTGYGRVVILEPAAGWLMVLAGLDTVERSVGETVLAGERVGTLAGALPGGAEFSLEAGASEGQTKRRKLYLELRREGRAIDPARWFAQPGE